jgi:hypothetical protein
MRRILCLAFLIALAAPAARAQTTVVTATVKDPNGIPYANGTVQAALSRAATVTINNQAQCSAASAGTAPCQVPVQGNVGPVTLDATGSFSLTLYSNTSMTPGGTTWNFTISISPGIPLPLGTGPQSFSDAISVTGATQSLSATLSAIAPALSNFSGAGTVTSISGTSPIVATPNPITGTGSISCPTCAIPAGGTGQFQVDSAASHLAGTAAILDCSQFAGGDVGAQINNCVAALPAGGGTANATNIKTGTISTAVNITASGVVLQLCPASTGMTQNAAVTVSGNSSAVMGFPGCGPINKAVNLDQITLSGFFDVAEWLNLNGDVGVFTGNGIVANNFGAQVLNNTVAGETQDGITATDATVSGNTVSSSGTIEIAVVGGITSLNTTSGGTPGAIGIEASDGQVTIVGNNVGEGDLTGTDQGGIVIFCSGFPWTVSGNYVSFSAGSSVDEYGILIEGEGGECGDATIGTNSVQGASGAHDVGYAVLAPVATSMFRLVFDHNIWTDVDRGIVDTSTATSKFINNTGTFITAAYSISNSNALVDDGVNQFTVATLPTVLDGSQVFASDGTPGSSPCTGSGSGSFAYHVNGAWRCAATSSGTVTSIATTSPITGGPITATGTIACATCTTSAAALTAGEILIGQGLQTMEADVKLDDGVTTANALTYAGSAGIISGTITASTFSANGTAGLSGSTLCSATITYSEGLITACTASSDPKLKVLGDYRDGLGAILAIDPIHFHWNEEGLRVASLSPSAANPEQIGFSAANVERAIPDAVGHDDQGYLTLPQGDRPIVAALVNAVKEQQAEIDALKAELRSLRPLPGPLAAFVGN